MYKFRVKELREKAGMTQHEVSLKTGIQNSTLRNIESNRVSYIQTVTLFKLKNLFGLDRLDELFDFNEKID
jgi:transcriptional regulator with XRE-family HTH domain